MFDTFRPDQDPAPEVPAPAPIQPSSQLSPESSSLLSSPELIDAARRVIAGGSLQPAPFIAMSPAGLTEVWSDLRALRNERASMLTKKGAKKSSTTESILAVLREASYQPNTAGFNKPELLARIAAPIELAVTSGRPIGLAIPVGGGKVAVSIKTGGRVGPDVAELTAAATLDALVVAINEFHAPGAFLVQMPDMGLHTGDTASPIERHLLHMARLRTWTSEVLAADQRLIYPNPLDHLGDNWIDIADAGARAARERLRRDPNSPLRGLARSMILSINTASEARSFEEDVLVYAAIAQPDLPGLPADAVEAGNLLVHRALAVTPGYVGTSDAIRSTGLLERLVALHNPDAVYFRLTVHPKPLEPRPLLLPTGRLAPKPGILPMHAVGVRSTADGKPRVGLAWELTARINGWRPVQGDGHVLYHEVS